MSSESKVIPASNISRLGGLNGIASKLAVPGVVNLMRAGTNTRFGVIQPAYKLAMQAQRNKKGLSIAANALALSSKETLVTFVSDGVVTVSRAVKRNFFSISVLSMYGLETSGNIPVMDSEQQIKDAAVAFLAGDAERMLVAGAVALAFPTIAEVQAAYDAYILNDGLANAATENLKTANRNVKILNSEADQVLNLAHTEIEGNYINEEPETMRAEARLWGMIYVRKGSDKQVAVHVTDIDTGLNLPDVDVSFKNGNNSGTTNAAGITVFNTTLMDVQEIDADHPLYLPYAANVTLVENENISIVIQMKTI